MIGREFVFRWLNRSLRAWLLVGAVVSASLVFATPNAAAVPAAPGTLDTAWCSSCPTPGLVIVTAPGAATSITGDAADSAQGTNQLLMAGTTTWPTRGEAFSIERLTLDGGADTTFGSAISGWSAGPGFQTLYARSDALPQQNELGAMTVDAANGDIIVGGTDGGNSSIALGKLTAAGAPAPGFGAGDGFEKIPVGSVTKGDVSALAVQTAHGILLAGQDTVPTLPVPYIGRVDATTGAADTTFGAAGAVVLPFSGYNAKVDRIRVGADGSIYAAGTHDVGAGYSEAFICKLSATDGALAPAYGVAGCANFHDSASAYDNDVAGLIVASDGSATVIFNSVYTGSGASHVVVARFTTTGTLDASFGDSGTVVLDTSTLSGACSACSGFSFPGSTTHASGAIDAGYGRFLVAGWTSDNAGDSAGEPIVAEFMSDGSLDTTFAGGAGYEVVGLSGGAHAATAIPVLTLGGNLYVAGSTDTSQAFALRFAGRAAVDTTPPPVPVITATTPAVNYWTRPMRLRATFTAAADDNSGLAGFSWHTDQNAATTPDATIDASASTTSYASSPASTGTYYLHVSAIDTAGNESAAATAGPFFIDATPPTVTASSQTTHTSATFTVAARDTDSGLAAAAYSFNGAAFQASNSDVLGGLNQGQRVSVSVRVRDAVGNISAPQTFSATTLPPVPPPPPPPPPPKPIPPKPIHTTVATGSYVMGKWLVVSIRGGDAGQHVRRKRVRVPKLGRNVLHVRIGTVYGHAKYRRIVVTRRLSFANPRLNRDIKLHANRAFAKRHPIRALFIATRVNIHRVFRWIGHPKDYPHIALSPPLVKELQWRLRALGYLPHRWRVHSVIDRTVIHAVEHFQKRHHVKAIGTVGPKTRRALDKSLRSFSRGEAVCRARVPQWQRHEGSHKAHKSLARCIAHAARHV